MSAPWFMALPGVTGAETVSEAGLQTWPDRALDDRLAHLSFCPVLLSEIYQIAWHYPLVVRDSAEGPLLMADLRAARHQRPVFDEAGRLARAYRPVASKLLPFTCSADGAPLRLQGPGLDAGPERSPALRRQILHLLAQQGESHRRITRALRVLMARDLLRPDAQDPGSWIPAGDPAPGAAPDPGQDETAATAPEGLFLGLRLLAVLDFAAMHRPGGDPRPRPAGEDLLPGLLARDARLRQQNFLDLGALISFDALKPAP